ncbi:MAG: flavodoxin [Candidatus Moranbacteria bacterium]|jgi:flavodoxin|nr:flavodoxin [Candidatus Moranbacteria bacterium]
MKKILVTYYSRTQTTRKVAENLAEKLGADIEEVKDTVDRTGVKGYWFSGKDATLRKLTVLEKSEKNLSDYNMVIIGTPIWSWNMSVPVRTYITENKDKFPDVAFFCTMGGSGNERAFKEMSEIIGKKPISILALKTVEVVKNSAKEKIEEFVKSLI